MGPKTHKLFLFFVIVIKIWIATWLYSVLLLSGGDVEHNPGPKQSCINTFSICHWNLSSLSAHNYAKIFLLKAYIAIHRFDIICISETYLDSSTSPDDNNLEISGYNFIRSDHPSNNKRGGICIYYKHFLPLRILNVQYLQECINFEMKIGDKVCNFISLYRSPSQTLDNFETFSKNFELNLENIVHRNPFLVVVIGDFNAKSSKWHCQDKSTFEGNVIDNITSQFGLYQVIKEPTHILNTSSSCIDLIFTSLPNLIIDSGVHSSLNPNWHHQTVYAKFNLEIIYPSPFCEKFGTTKMLVLNLFEEQLTVLIGQEPFQIRV